MAETATTYSLDQVKQVFPALIARIIQEEAEEHSLNEIDFVQREYTPADKPVLTLAGESSVRLYTGGSGSYILLEDGKYDFFPLPTQEGKERIGADEIWIINTMHPEGEDSELHEDEYYMLVSQCIDVSLE
jgi:hypothetical protein